MNTFHWSCGSARRRAVTNQKHSVQSAGVVNNLAERTLRAVAIGRNNWGAVGSEVGGQTAATLYSIVGTCKHLSIDPWAYLRESLPGLFALGEKPTTEQLRDWLPDRWLLTRTRDRPVTNSSPHQSQ
jgi:hypothetical protein